MAGDGATLKDFSLRGKGDRRETEGEMCDRLKACTILNKSWTGGFSCPTPTSHKKTPSLCLCNRSSGLFSIAMPDTKIIGNRNFRACS